MYFEREEEDFITQGEFNLVFEKQVVRCAETLQRKTKEYTGDNPDRLSAFKVAATMQGCSQVKGACRYDGKTYRVAL